jgi:hypothetical protein
MKKPFGVRFMRKMAFVNSSSERGTCTWSGAPPNQTSDDND